MQVTDATGRVRERWGAATVLDVSDVSRDDGVRLAVLIGMVAGLGALLGAFVSTSGFVGSDFFSFRDAQEGLSLGFLTRPVFDHFVPGHRLGFWAVGVISPFDFGLTTAVVVAVFMATLLVFHRLMAELFRPGPGPMLLTLFYGASAVHVGTGQWWSAALSRMPSMLFVLLMFLTYLRWHRSGNRTALAGSVLSLAAALSFSEDAAVALVVLVALRVLLVDSATPVVAAARVALSEWRVWMLYLAPILVSFIGVTAQTTAAGGASPLGNAGRYLGAAWFHGFTPAVFGQYVNHGPLTGVEMVIVVASQAALAALVAWTVRRRKVAGRGWLFFAVGFAVTQLPVALVRTVIFTPELVAHQYRYYSQTIAYFAIALGFAFLPVRNGGPSGAAVAPGPAGEDTGEELDPELDAELDAEPDDGTGAGAGGGRRRARAGAPRWALVAGLATVATLYVAASAWMGARVMHEFVGGRSGRYLDALRADVSLVTSQPGRAVVMDGDLPGAMIDRIYAPANRLSFLLPLLGYDDIIGTSGDRVHRVLANGRLEQVAFTPLVGGPATELLASGRLATMPAEAANVSEGAVCVQSGEKAPAIGLFPLVPVGDGEWYLRMNYTVSTSVPGLEGPRVLPGRVLVNHGEGFVDAADPRIGFVAGRSEAVVSLGRAGFTTVVVIPPSRSRLCISEATIALIVPQGRVRG